MRAARWDIEWEVGSPWRVLLRRRDLGGAPLPLLGPCALEIRPPDAASSTTPLLTVTAVLDAEDAEDPQWLLQVPAAATSTLGPGTFEHRLLVTLSTGGEPETWARGSLRARDTLRDVR